MAITSIPLQRIDMSLRFVADIPLLPHQFYDRPQRPEVRVHYKPVVLFH